MNNNKVINKLIAIICIIFTFFAVGCTDNKKVVEGYGSKVEVPQKIERIISTVPSNTEILVGLGLADKLVAIDTYAKDVEGISEKSVVMDFYTPNIEEIMSLKPDLMVASDINVPSAGENPYKALSDAGISVVYIKTPNSINEIYEEIEYLMTLTGTEEKGKKIIENMKTEISKVQEKTAKITNKKSVYFEIEPAPTMYTFGSETFSNELLETAGGINIFANEKKWFAPSVETIISLNPDVIITNETLIDDPISEIKNRQSFKQLNAVKANQVFLVEQNSTSRPSQHIIKGIIEINKILYPELYE